MKRRIADGSVGFPHVRVGHRQASIPNPPAARAAGGFAFAQKKTAAACRDLSISYLPDTANALVPEQYPSYAMG